MHIYFKILKLNSIFEFIGMLDFILRDSLFCFFLEFLYYKIQYKKEMGNLDKIFIWEIL